MHEQPSTRRILLAAVAAMVAGLGVLSLLAGFSDSWPLRAAEALSVFGLGVVIIGGSVVLALVRLGGWRETDAEFDLLVRRAEQLAAEDRWGHGDDEEDFFSDRVAFRFTQPPPREPIRFGDAFDDLDDVEQSELDVDALVRSAVGGLPIEYHLALEHVAIVVQDGGLQSEAVTEDYFDDRIVLSRDALVRDFGDDPIRLREAVDRTVRNELARRL